ncbi:hypothetical protein Scep_017340 [Stephania cephalantha]|uniref:Myb/SANT-like domain-containing protein n=1 Tax=Stephania cephalantha TaxID=152367 RepID=A0AAP0IPF4_9MAGN
MEESIGSVKVVSKGQVRWNDRMDKIMIEIILEEYGFGNASGNSWKPEVYTRVCLELLKQLKQQVHPANVKARIKTLKANYFSAREVISQSGFGWDPEIHGLSQSRCFDMERISSRNIREKESYREEVCVPYYDELCVIFGDDQALWRECNCGNEANIELPSLEEMCNAEKSLPTKEEKDEVNHSSSSATRTGSNGQRTKRKKSSNIDATRAMTNNNLPID